MNQTSLLKNPLALALLGSVLINGILIGTYASTRNTAKPAQTALTAPTEPQRMGRADELPRLLNPQERKRFDQLARQSVGADMQEARKQLHNKRAALARALHADVFDLDVLDAAMAEVRESRNAIAHISDRAISSYLEKASPDERSKVLRRMSRPHRLNGSNKRRAGPRSEPSPQKRAIKHDKQTQELQKNQEP